MGLKTLVKFSPNLVQTFMQESEKPVKQGIKLSE
jgi:hypothetical protein